MLAEQPLGGRTRWTPLPTRLTRHSLGQCCGGPISLVTEAAAGPRRALRVERSAPEPPSSGGTRVVDGWRVEPVVGAGEPLWIWGAGRVGRAPIAALAPLGRFEIAWIDVAGDRASPPPTPRRAAWSPRTHRRSPPARRAGRAT